MNFASLEGKKYLNLESFRRNGTGVRTPVWFTAAPGGLLYVYTTANAGKTKRIRRSGVVRIAACNARGAITGPWIDAHAEIVGEAEFIEGMRLLNRKYWPVKQILDLSVLLFGRHQRVMIAVRPA